MREAIVNKVVEMLNNNSGNRITGELIFGVASYLNQEFLKMENETPKPAESPAE